MNSYKNGPSVTLFSIGIDIERAAVPSYPFSLDLKALCVPIAMTMDRNRSSYRNDPFLQSCVPGPGRWGQCEIPDLALGTHFHRRMRPSQADALFDGAC